MLVAYDARLRFQRDDDPPARLAGENIGLKQVDQWSVTQVRPDPLRLSGPSRTP
jgi:hypothetical protein